MHEFPKKMYIRFEEDNIASGDGGYYLASRELDGMDDGEVAIYTLEEVGTKTTESTFNKN